MTGMPAVAVVLTVLGSGRPLPGLSSEYSESDRVLVRATSAGFRLPGGATILTQEVRNFEHNGLIGYRCNTDWTGVVPGAGLTDGVVVPTAVISTRTTYRRVDEVDGGMAYILPLATTVNTRVSGRQWAEGGKAATSEPGRTLAASLYLDDTRQRVVCTSAVTGRPRDGFTYSYTVRNETRQPIAFEWGDFSAKLEPGKSKAFEVNSAAVFAERSGTCKVALDKGPDYTFRTTAWLPAP